MKAFIGISVLALTVGCVPTSPESECLIDMDFADTGTETSGTGTMSDFPEDVGDGDGDPAGDGDGEPVSSCNFPLASCPNDDCTASGRRNLADLSCGSDGCLGLWSGTDVWVSLLSSAYVITFPIVGRTDVWECEPAPDVDICVEMPNGVRCFRIDGMFAAAVWPACAADSTLTVDVGNDMCGQPDAGL